MEKDFGAKVVVLGGGTGSFVVLSGLRHYVRGITALVSMADDGGSTGQLRDELGVLPPGDVRQCLVALSRSPRVRELFNYRFDEGEMAGHAFGNLFLTALEKMTGSFVEAVDLAENVLRVDGHVVPITLDNVMVCMNDGGGKLIRQERNIDDATFAQKRPKLWLEPEPRVNQEATDAISRADIVVIAPGSLYTSIGPVLVVPGIGEALAKTNAKVVYVANLVNKPGQTDGFGVDDLASEVERIGGGEFLDYVIYNTDEPTRKLLKLYATDGELPVVVNPEKLQSARWEAIGAKLLAGEIWQNRGSSADVLAKQRTLIRHNPDALAREIMKIYFS